MSATHAFKLLDVRDDFGPGLRVTPAVLDALVASFKGSVPIVADLSPMEEHWTAHLGHLESVERRMGELWGEARFNGVGAVPLRVAAFGLALMMMNGPDLTDPLSMAHLRITGAFPASGPRPGYEPPTLHVPAVGLPVELTAQALYERYCEHARWLNYQGLPCPRWNAAATFGSPAATLTEAIREHWRATARFVLAHGFAYPDPETP